MSETFWLSISLITVLSLSYKPVKAFTQNFLGAKIGQATRLLKEAEKTHQDAQLYLKKVEKDLNNQLQINEQVLEQTKSQLAELTLKSKKETDLEIKRQLEIAKMKREIDEEVLKKEIVSAVLTQSVERIIFELEKNSSKDANYINNSLNRLEKLHIKSELFH